MNDQGPVRGGSGDSEQADDRVTRRLGDLAEFIREADFLASKGRDAYLADSMDGALPRNAGERILIKVATVAEKLPSTFKERHPEVDWRGINRMRNLAAHHDDRVSHDLVWAALTVRVPGLGSSLGLRPDRAAPTADSSD